MLVTKELRDFWGPLFERGDVTELAKLVNRDTSTISKILSGDEERTSTEVVLAINKFYKKRKDQRKRATQIDAD